MFLLLSLWACSPQPTTEPLTVDLRPRVVEILTEPVTGHLNRRFPSKLEAKKDAWLSSEAGGKIDSIDIKIGQVVKKGDLLLSLNPEKATANKSLAESRLADAKAVVKDALAQKRRLASLGSQISEADLDKSVIALSRAMAAKDGANAQLELASRQLADQRITAPFDGTVVTIRPSVGELLPPGQAAIRIIDNSAHIVRIGLVEDEVGLAKNPNTVFSVQVGDTEIPLTLNHVSAATDGGLSWPAELSANAHPKLITGLPLTVKGAFSLPNAESKVPLSAINDNNEVWIIDGENQVSAKPISIIAEQGDSLYVTGIEPETRIVKQSARTLKEGVLVVPLKAP